MKSSWSLEPWVLRRDGARGAAIKRADVNTRKVDWLDWRVMKRGSYPWHYSLGLDRPNFLLQMIFFSPIAWSSSFLATSTKISINASIILQHLWTSLVRWKKKKRKHWPSALHPIQVWSRNNVLNFLFLIRFQVWKYAFQFFAFYEACRLEWKIALSHSLTSLVTKVWPHRVHVQAFWSTQILSCQHPCLSQGSCQENASKQAEWTHMPAKCCHWSSLIR